MQYDVFISHASEDKISVARPLAALLTQAGLKVWLDEFELKLGDSLRRKIDDGLSKSKYGVVILSSDFFKKEWPQKELDALVAREDGRGKVILPIWHNLTRIEVLSFSPVLADRLSVNTSSGINVVADAILETVQIESEYVAPAKTVIPKTAMDYVIKFLDRYEEQDYAPNIEGLATGFYDLDRFLGGLKPGEITVLAARPSMGSTTFAINTALHIALHEALPVIYFSLDASASDITQRMLAATGRISRRNLRSGRHTEEEWPRLVEAIENIRDSVFYIEADLNLSLPDIVEKSKAAAQASGKIAYIVIDNLQKLLDHNAITNSSVLLRKLGQLARELNCPILLLASLPMTLETRIDKRPQLSDLSSIDAVQEYAKTVLFLYSDEHYYHESREPGIAEIIVAQQRGGQTGVVKLVFLKELGRMETLLPQQ